MGNAHKKAFPYEGKAARRSRDGRGRYKFDTTSQSAFGCQHPYPFCPRGRFPLIGGIGPWEGSLWLSDDILI